MLTYNTSLQDSSPGYAPLSGLRLQSPYSKYGSNHQDILNSMGDAAAADYDVAQSKSNAAYTLSQQEAQNQLALRGLNQMAEAQQNRSNVYNTRLQNMFGVANNLLGGLFG
jgi:hypothetical protein